MEMLTEKKRISIQERFMHKLGNSWYFRLFLLRMMPIALITGLRIRHIDHNSCTCSVPYKWFTQNPFMSIYFASQSMAAEMSTGALAMMKIQGYDVGISMLVLNMDGAFHKKAKSRIFFTCTSGEAMDVAIQKAIATNEGVSISVQTIGKDTEGLVVSTFTFTWTFKVKSK